jgi:serine protease
MVLSRTLAGLAIGGLLAAGAAAQQARVIVGFKPGAATLREQAMSVAASRETVAALAQRRAERLAAHARVGLTAGRVITATEQVVRARGIDGATLAARLAAHPDVAYAEPDRRYRALYRPNDPLFAAGPASGRGPDVGQWYLRSPDALFRSAINAEAAWDLVRASPAVIVAVLDTGVLADHSDLAGAVLPGFDMVSDVDTANDGDARDANAGDPGDWVTPEEDADTAGPFGDCGADDSSWHGTQVAGIIAANAGNGQGIAGVAFGARILPVRVLGKCGGSTSDIAAGMYWAAGIDQPGQPASRTPARVLNLSLGSSGPCPTSYRLAAEAITARGVVLVGAAGNSAGHATGSPANCPGFIAVAGLRHAGSKVGFSDLGGEITISAPGGNCINIGPGEPCLYPIATTTNSGTRGPVAGGSTWSDSFNRSVGTSFAAPLVAGTVALMLSARPELTPAEVRSALRRGARPFPTTGADNGTDPTPVTPCVTPSFVDQLQCYCTTALCGAGMLDAAAAVRAAQSSPNAEENANRLFDFAERNYADYFSSVPFRGTYAPFVYRYYPATGIYLGVVVQEHPGYVLSGVYVMGGPFGGTPVYKGLVSDYIALSAGSPAAWGLR